MTLNFIETFETSIYNTKHIKNIELHCQQNSIIIFSNIHILENYKVIKISVFRLFSWPAFGGLKVLVYIYTYIYIYYTRGFTNDQYSRICYGPSSARASRQRPWRRARQACWCRLEQGDDAAEDAPPAPALAGSAA